MSPHHSDAEPLPHSISGDKGLSRPPLPAVPPDRTAVLNSPHVCLPGWVENFVPNIQGPLSWTICNPQEPSPIPGFHKHLPLFRQGSPCRSMVFPCGQAWGTGNRSGPRSSYVPSPSGRWHLLCLLLLLPLSVELRLTGKIQRQSFRFTLDCRCPRHSGRCLQTI